MTPAELIGIVLGAIAIGLGLFTFLFDRYKRGLEEKFYAHEIKENLKAISQYFLKVSKMSSHYNENQDEQDIVLSLNDFYVRNHQQMADLLYLTKLYLTQWKTLNENQKTVVKEILERFSWLSYEYYPLHMPESIRETRWQNEWEALDNKKSYVTENVSMILAVKP